MANSSPLRGSEALSASPGAGPWGARSEVADAGSDSIWLTAGEAADAARVAHRQIAAWVATDELSARTGWRGGAEIRLVLLSDLEALAESIDLDCIRGSLEARGVFTGPRHSLLGTPRRGRLREEARDSSAAVGSKDAAIQSEDRQWQPEDRQWAEDLEQEIQRLRGVIVTLREDHESLERHLEARAAVPSGRRFGASTKKSASIQLSPSMPATASLLPGGHEPLASVLGGPGGTKGTLVSIAAGLLLGLGGAALASALFPGAAGSGDSATSLVHAASLDVGRRAGESTAPSSESPRVIAGGNLQAPLESSVKASGPASLSPSESVPPDSGPSDQSSTAELEAPLVIAGSEDDTLRRAGRALQQPRVNESRGPSSEDDDSSAGPKRLSLPTELAEIDPAIFSRNSAVLADCAYTEFVAGDSLGSGSHGDLDGELVLGPCFGPARGSSNPAMKGKLAVPGTHRVGSVSCCRHHAFVERMTSASTDDAAREGLTTEAAASLAEGVLPPLFRLRADRSASRFLREETRGWESAGLDGLSGMLKTDGALHEWKLATSQPPGDGVRVHLESWLQASSRLAPEQGLGRGSSAASAGRRTSPEVRRFRMTLLIQAAPRGDVLESFEWLAD